MDTSPIKLTASLSDWVWLSLNVTDSVWDMHGASGYLRWVWKDVITIKRLGNPCEIYGQFFVIGILFPSVSWFRKSPLTRRGVLKEVLYGGCYALRSNPSPFYIPLLTENKWYPFHLPSLEFCILFNCCKCTVLNKLENQKIFLTFPQPKKLSVNLLGLFTDWNDRFLCPLIYFITGSTPPQPLPGSYSFELFKFHDFFHDFSKFSKTLGLAVTIKIF